MLSKIHHEYSVSEIILRWCLQLKVDHCVYLDKQQLQCHKVPFYKQHFMSILIWIKKKRKHKKEKSNYNIQVGACGEAGLVLISDSKHQSQS